MILQMIDVVLFITSDFFPLGPLGRQGERERERDLMGRQGMIKAIELVSDSVFNCLERE